MIKVYFDTRAVQASALFNATKFMVEYDGTLHIKNDDSKDVAIFANGTWVYVQDEKVAVSIADKK